MKTKDLVYVGVIGYLAYLLMKKKPVSQINQGTSLTGSAPSSTNLPKEGLTLGENMDLSNLTPTPANGMSTEVALNNSNITPLIKDDIKPNPIVTTPRPAPIVTTPRPIPTLTVTTPRPTATTTVTTPRPTSTITTPRPTSTITSPRPTSTVTSPRPTSSTTSPRPTSSTTSPRPNGTAVSTVREPTAVLSRVIQPSQEQLLLECGKSFSIPNNDKEGTISNYFYDGINFFTQTTGSLIKTVPTKISNEAFAEACRKFQIFQKTKKV